MKIKHSDVEGRQRSCLLPQSQGRRWVRISASAILASAIMLALLLAFTGAVAQDDELECHYPGQKYPFSTTPCRDDWDYKWVAWVWNDTLNDWIPADNTFEGGIDDNCSINWTAPPVTAEKDFKLVLTVYNNETYDSMFVSCIAMDNISIRVCPLANITVTKFYDVNGDGNRDAVEPSLEGWYMSLYSGYGCIGDPIDSKWTAGEDGSCNFTGLLPGEYSVKETLKPGWEVTYPDTVCQNLTLASGENAKISFGNHGNLSISGVKFYDPNGTGEVTGKDWLGGWNITLSIWNETAGEYEELNKTTTSPNAGTLGQYSFDYLIPARYRVCETLKDGWEQTYPDPGTDDGCHIVDLTGEEPQSMTDADFGNRGDLNVTICKFNDLDGDGEKGDGESTVPFWPVNLTGPYGYSFDGETGESGCVGLRYLPPGEYTASEGMIAGWVNITPTSETFNLDPTNSPYNVSFGNRGNLSISGVKFYDPNDTGEVAGKDRLGGWNITLSIWNETAGEYEELNKTTTSPNAGTLGQYSFDYLIPARYRVCETLKDGWEQTYPDPGTDDGCHIVDLTGEEPQSMTDADFGNRGDLDLDPCKFNDLNGNGTWDDGEPGIPGWKMTVIGPDGYEETLLTGEGGCVMFENLVPGEYTVSEEMRDGWIATTPTSETVTLDRESSPKQIKFGNMQPDFEVRKIALNKAVKRGEEITYLIQVNTKITTLKNVTVKDVFNRPVEFVSASPMPDADGIWRLGNVEVGTLSVDEDDPEWRTLITLVVKVPDKQDFEYDMAQGVVGEGFVNVKNDYSTTYQSYVITNCIEVTIDNEPHLGKVFKDCETVTVMIDPGTELSTREHGSGTYESEEIVKMRTENKSISMDKDMAATYSPTSIGLYRGRTVDYSSRWTEVADAKNRVTGASMSEQYRYAMSIDRESSFFLDKNESMMEIESEFDGMGHIGFLKMPSNTSTVHDTPTIEIREDYIGSFKILEKAEEYGSSVTYEKSASGAGSMAADKRVKDSQRSYEYGTGTYESDEVIKTASNYMAKDISVVHAPTSQSLTDDVSLDQDLKWKEGMSSKNPERSFIGEEYTSIESLDKDTVALGLNKMSTEAVFSGEAEYRVVLTDGVGDNPIEMDDKYVGDYSIERNVALRGVPTYDQPHLNVTKTLEGVDYVKDPVHGTKETVLAGEDVENMIYVATYEITVENDGNKDLKPVYVVDYFPPNTRFIEPASMKPSSLSVDSANWTLTHLSIGDQMTITLKLDVTEYYDQYSTGSVGDEMVNRVKVCGGYDKDDWVCAANSSACERGYLTCCIDQTLYVTKTARVDENEPEMVWYTVEIENFADATRVATVTDILPEGMVLLESSRSPASYDVDTVIWNLIEIEPFKTETIEYKVEALKKGRFVNQVCVDARSVDGPVVQPVYAEAEILIPDEECHPQYDGGWQPPNWDFENVAFGDDPDATCDMNCELAP